MKEQRSKNEEQRTKIKDINAVLKEYGLKDKD